MKMFTTKVQLPWLVLLIFIVCNVLAIICVLAQAISIRGLTREYVAAMEFRTNEIMKTLETPATSKMVGLTGTQYSGLSRLGNWRTTIREAPVR